MRPEILAPVGSMEALEAALAAGCDAVYFGLPNFGARAFANNFDLETTKKVIDRCHLCDVKVYITMNTILYEDEIEDAYDMALSVHKMGVDALIIQDLGFLHLLHHRLPNLVLHASTQLSLNHPYQIEQLKKLGVCRVVLARECTKDEIKACVEAGLEVEVFVHGAICISYSGQCYFSSVHYGRSGNRGMCAQPCRMKYSLLKDGKRVDTSGDYLLSPKDLSLIDDVNVLSDLGVCSLKIEGRMKSASYVYESVSLVKKALSHEKVSKLDQENLMVSFNRGYTKGHMYDLRGNALMNSLTSNHQGIVIGRVVSVKRNSIFIDLKHDLYQNDGIRFESGDHSLGCHVNYIYDKNHRLVSFMEKGHIVEIKGPDGVKVNSIVHLTVSANLNKQIDKMIHDTNRQIGIDGFVSCGGIDCPLVIEASYQGHRVCVVSNELASASINRATDEAVLSKQLKKTKDSWAYFKNIEFDLAPDIYFSISVMNQLRRDVLDQLKSEVLKVDDVIEHEYRVKLNASYLDMDLIEISNKNQKVDVPALWVSEFEGVLKKANLCEVDGIVCAHLGCGEIVDSLNVTNSYAVAALMEMGYRGCVLSDELNLHQVKLLMQGFKERYGFVAPVYKTIYQKRRLMTMNHCPVNTALSNGLRKDCNLCHRFRFELEGLDSKRVYCQGDSMCHMCLYDVEPSDERHFMDDYRVLGVSYFRYVFVDESKEMVKNILCM